MLLADATFFCATFFITYAYALYPLGIWVLARWKRQPPPPPLALDLCPEVTVVIAVHNEAGRIAAKVANLRALDYPQDRLHILFVSDGSTDDTADRIREIAGVTVIDYAQRQGKAHALNTAMTQVDTEVVLFCDVRQMADPMALRHILGRLMRPGVGAVSGELVHRDPANATSAQIGLYWRYEKWIRKSESEVASVVGATGAFYAIRRKHFVPLAPDTLLDDFEIPMQIVRQGLRVQFEGRAVVYDELQKDLAGERKRKVRTLGGNFQSFARHPWLFSPSSNPICLQFVSHKVCRLAVPYAMILALFSSLLSHTALVQTAAAAQLVFYAAALGGRLIPALARNRLISFAGVFLELNWVAMLAGIQYWRGRLDTRWEKT
ncbi:glycosyltransferase family 2 protein [Aquabacterium sp.]|uniref:glycosyltransferase family 2 protein n=1 Tax=Aquabacterium sp. TaxID=1872578 RepID=UPI0025B84625|nr:glycosyltransferase family 2 protein [Aquabacterium sp.]